MLITKQLEFVAESAKPWAENPRAHQAEATYVTRVLWDIGFILNNIKHLLTRCVLTYHKHIRI